MKKFALTASLCFFVGAMVGFSLGHRPLDKPQQNCQDEIDRAILKYSTDAVVLNSGLLKELERGDSNKLNSALNQFIALNASLVWMEIPKVYDSNVVSSIRHTVISSLRELNRDNLNNELRRSLQVIPRASVSNGWVMISAELDRIN